MDCQLVKSLLISLLQYLASYNNLSSKDTVIRVWNRKTLEVHRVLRGHDGPVNAIGLQNDRVVGITSLAAFDY